MKISNVKILYKILSCFALLGLVVGWAIWFATSQMQDINNRYSHIIDNDVVAMKAMIRSNVRAVNYGRLAWQMVAETDPAARMKLDEEVTANKKDFESLVALAKEHAPKLSGGIDQVSQAFDGLDKTYANVKKELLANNTAGAIGQMQGFVAKRKELSGYLTSTNDALEKTMQELSDAATADTKSAIFITTASIAGALAAVLALAFLLSQYGIARPLARLSGTMEKLARGEFDVDVEGVTRKDEVGLMATSVEVFKKNGIEANRLRKEQEETRAANEREQASRRAADEVTSTERAMMAEMIGSGLNKLAAKDLTYRVSNMPEAYHKLQEDFNSALDQLEEAIQAVAGNTDTINSGTQEISSASDDMSRRTETQAANIEETAAAVAEITATVRKTAAGAVQAREVVAGATEEATKSSEVVRKAIEAMNGIEKSSQQINQIIGVIDEIAFQTNLLALNAGVEAARAGDAGRGFAVVASEVRALAQRSAEAAKEIKALLQTSRSQVEQGVKLVAETGTSLDRIVERVAQVNTVVSEIATNAQTQAAGLQEVNTAVGQMDQTTQQNAAMAEESTAATRTLAGQSQELASVVAAFTTRALRSVMPKRQEAAKPAAQAHKPAPLAAKPAPKKAAAGGGAGDSWEEF